MRSHSEEFLLEKENLSKHRVDKNRLLLASIINVLTVCCAIFSMLFYQWIYISFTFGERQDVHQLQTVNLWINLLYAANPDQSEYYLSYETLQDKVCIHDDTFCKAIFLELDFIGKLSFSIFAFAFLVSLYDAVRLIRFGCAEIVTRSKFFVQKSTAGNYKNNFRIVIMIVAYVVGLTLNYFAMTLMSLDNYKYGVSFWVFFSSLIAFGLTSIYQNRKMSKIERQELIIKLISKEKEILQNSNKDEDGSMSEQLLI